MNYALASQSAMTATGVEIWVNTRLGKTISIDGRTFAIKEILDFKLIQSSQDLAYVVAWVRIEEIRDYGRMLR